MQRNNRKWCLGLMSGTSLDGVDAALIETDGDQIFGFGDSGFLPYDDAEQDCIRRGLGCWHDDPKVPDIAALVDAKHIDLARQYPTADLIGYHGQTLAHDPDHQRTHQCGDGANLAQALARPVVWDFRSNDVEMGGQGAPLAPVFHHAMVRMTGTTAPVAVLNLGGVGNITFVDPTLPPDQGLLACDTGPANAPMNDVMQRHFGEPHDVDGARAARGVVDQNIIDRFLAHRYFQRMPPKSLDRNSFGDLVQACTTLSPHDALATLARACVLSVKQAMGFAQKPMSALWVTGGGRKNGWLMQHLAQALPCPVINIDDLGFDGDMVEAQAFAYLAARVERGLPTSFPSTTATPMPVGGGIISRP